MTIEHNDAIHPDANSPPIEPKKPEREIKALIGPDGATTIVIPSQAYGRLPREEPSYRFDVHGCLYVETDDDIANEGWSDDEPPESAYADDDERHDDDPPESASLENNERSDEDVVDPRSPWSGVVAPAIVPTSLHVTGRPSGSEPQAGGPLDLSKDASNQKCAKELARELVAMCMRVPGLAMETLTWLSKTHLSYRVCDEAGNRLIGMLSALLESYGPTVVTLADWPERIRERFQANVNHGTQANPEMVLWQAEQIIQLAFGPNLPSPSLEAGRCLLKKTIRQGLVEKATETLKDKWLPAEAKTTFLAEVTALLAELDASATTDGFTVQAETLEQFLARPKEQSYLVEDILASDQIAIIGGPEKGQKSNIAMDLALSLATGTKFLNDFTVPTPVNVLVLTGETREKPLHNLLFRILAAKSNVYIPGLSPSNLPPMMHGRLPAGLIIKQDLPSLNSPSDLATLRQLIHLNQSRVVIIDPLYFTLGADPKGRPVDTNSLVQVGKLMLSAGKVCIDSGCTPIFCHHMSKGSQFQRSQNRDAMQLSDLTGAGFGAVARQWILVNYLAPYDPETGRCTVWMNVGGSAGHGTLATVQITEGVFDSRACLNGRRWQVKVDTGAKAIYEANRILQTEKLRKKDTQLHSDEATILGFLHGRSRGETQQGIHEATGIPKPRVGVALQGLLKRGSVGKSTISKPAGKNPGMPHESWVNITLGYPRTDAQSARIKNGEFLDAVLGPRPTLAESSPSSGPAEAPTGPPPSPS